MANPNAPSTGPQTFGELYTQIQEKNILTAEEENTLRQRAMEKYGMTGLLAKRKERISSDTRNELSGLLSGLPEREQILAKLDSMLPGYTAEKQRKQSPDRAKGNPPDALANAPDGADNLTRAVEDAIPTATAAVAGLGAAVVGTGLVTEKGWKSTLVGGWTHLKEWVAGLLPEGGILGGLKDWIMGIFAKIGGALGIKKEGEQREETETPSDGVKKESERGAKNVFEKLTKDGTAKNPNLQVYFTDQRILGKSINELKKLSAENKSNTGEFAEKLGFKKEEGKIVYSAVGLLLSKETEGYMKSLSIKNSQDVPVARLFSGVARYADMIERIRSRGKDLDLKDMSFGDGSFLENMKEFAGDKKDMLNDLRTRFAGFTPKVLARIHTGYSTKPISQGVNFEASMGEFSEAEQTFLRETLPNYSKALPDLIKSFSFGSPGAEKFIQKHLQNINYADLIDIFVLSGGNTSLENMNAFEKSQVLIRIFLMIRKGNGSDGYGYLSSLSGAVLSSDTSIKIPSDVKMILGDLTEIFKDALSKTLTEAKDMALGIAKVNPWFATGVGATLAGALWLAIRLTPVGRVASTFMWIIAALGIGGTAMAGYKMTESGKIIEEKSGKEVADLPKIEAEIKKQK